MKTPSSATPPHPLTVDQIGQGSTRETPAWLPVFSHLSLITTVAEYVYPRHQHPGYEVILVDGGPYRCLLNDTELSLEAREILVVKPGDWHQDFLVPPARYYGLSFHFSGQHGIDGAPPSIFVDVVKPEQQVVREAHDALWPIVRQIDAEHQIGDEISSHLQDALLNEFFWRLIRSLPRKVLSAELLDSSPADGFVKNVTRLFRSRVTESFSIDEIARALNMSASTLSRKCVKELGMPPMRAFMLCKIDRAKLLLQHTAMSIKEISEYLRFKDQYHFSKVFKRVVGHPPSEFG